MKRLVLAALIAVAAVVPSVVLAREEPATRGVAAPSPRPTPVVVGVPFATAAPSAELLVDVTGEVLTGVGGPSVTLPPTDTQ
jgi:hypothetical protein